MFGNVSVKAYKHVFTTFILPLHNASAFELMAHVVALLFSAQGLRYPHSHASTGTIVALVGVLLFLPCVCYSFSIHLGNLTEDNDRLWMGALMFLFAAEIAPQALAHKSVLMEFAAAVCLFCSLRALCSSADMKGPWQRV